MEQAQTIKDSIRNYILGNTYADKEKIQDSTLIFKEGFFDSMGLISLISFLEEQFRVQTQDNDLVEENFESINAIFTYVSGRIAKAA